MRQLRILAFAVAVPLVAIGATREVLLGTTPTLIPRTPSTTSLLIFNSGAVPICCAQTSDGGAPPDCVPIASGSNMALDIPSNQPVRCSSSTQQAADAGTRVMELY